MDDNRTAAEAGTSASGISTALDTGPSERGPAIITPPVPAIPAETVIAEAIVLAEPKTATGMIARANELYRAGVVDKCAELFRIVAQLKDQVMRERTMTWKDFVEKSFTFSLATADNYARVGRGKSAVLTALGAIRHLHPSGQPGHKATKKTVSKEEMATATDAETTEKRTAPAALMSGAPSNASRPPELPRVGVEVALKALRAASLAREIPVPKCMLNLTAARGKVTLLRNDLARAEQDLADTEKQILDAYREFKARRVAS